jgi:recombination protein RecA
MLVPRRPAGHQSAQEGAAPAGWSFAALAGRFVELSAGWNSAALTLATTLVWQAQGAGEPVAWIMEAQSGFYPPDAAANGVDLAALAVVRIPGNDAARAAGRLARSGAFGLIVLDLGPRGRVPPALQGSLVQQAQRHGTAILCLTEKPLRAPSLGTLVALRGQARRQRRGPDRFACALDICKDKRRGPGWTHEEEAHGPPGLR